MSPYLIAVVSSWFVAQSAKFLLESFKEKRWSDLRQLYRSGSMPSSHSAAAVALLTIVGFKDGTNSGLFAMAALFAAIVMYDAVMVRRSTGEQGTVIRAILSELKSAIRTPRAAKGHEPKEVIVGALIGLFVGTSVHLLV